MVLGSALRLTGHAFFSPAGCCCFQFPAGCCFPLAAAVSCWLLLLSFIIPESDRYRVLLVVVKFPN